VADFDLDSPITTTKEARDESARPVKDDPSPHTRSEPAKHEGKVASVARKAADAVKAAAASVVEAVEHRKGHTGSQGADGRGGDVKDPEVRAAETRNPDASTPAPDATRSGLPDGAPAPTTPAEAAGAADNRPAGDGKPAGDTEQGDSIVSEANAAQQRSYTQDDNPGQSAQRGTEEKK
jgi:NADH-quinone oxidoreductase subunit E